MKPLLLMAVFFMTMISQSNADVITRCGEAAGYAYYQACGLVPEDNAGWTKDSVSGGILLLKKGDDFDIILNDGTPLKSSALADGGSPVGFAVGGGT